MTTRFHQASAEAGIPLRTLEQVRAALEQAKATGSDAAMAKLMLRHGRLTDDARMYVRAYAADHGAV